MHSQAFRYLTAILEAGSISRAAAALEISQPSLSQYVQRLEKDVGAELFDRSTRPLSLTESGRIFYDAEKRVAQIREDCRRAVLDINGGERGRVVIGASEYREIFFLTEVLPVFRAAHPGIEIALEEGTTRELEEFVWSGKTDLSLVIAPLAQPGLESIEICEERLLLGGLPAATAASRISAFSFQTPSRRALHRRARRTADPRPLPLACRANRGFSQNRP